MSFPRLRFRDALRKLASEPLLNGAALLVLALGIGANTLMFMVLDHMVLRPVPFPQLDRLAILWETDARQGVNKGAVSAPDFLEWKTRAQSFSGLAAIRRSPVGFRAPGARLEQVPAAWVTEDFFPLLGARAEIGRLFGPEDSGDFETLAVISHSLWQRALGGNPGIVGQTVEIDGRSLTIAGVLRQNEAFPRGTEIWLPVRLVADPAERGHRALLVVGRLGPAATLASARTEMNGIAAQLQREAPGTNQNTGAAVDPLREELVSRYRSTIYLLFGALALTLLIVCVNVANMLLVRAAARRREIAIRVALGARRRDILAQLAAEVLLLSAAGTLLGLVLTLAGRSLLAASPLGTVLRADALTLDWRLMVFMAALTLLTGLFMALAPALQYIGTQFNPLMVKDREQGKAEGLRVLVLQRLLVMLQLAVSLPLLMGAILLLQNVRQLGNLDLGFRSEGVQILRVAFPPSSPEGSQRIQVVADGLERLRAHPGIDSVGLVSDLPFSGSRTSGGFVISGRTAAPDNEPFSDLRVVAGDYFKVLGIPLRSGRALVAGDGPFSPGVAVINEALAQQFFPGENPLGQRIRIGAPEEVAVFGGSIQREIVGVVGNVVHEGVGAEARPEIYLPYGQNPTSSAAVLFRTEPGTPGNLAGLSAFFVGERNDVIVSGPSDFSEMISRSLGFPEVQAGVVTTLSLLSLALVLMSVYAIMSYLVARRRKSIAIRLALGAQNRQIVELMMRQSAILCLGGLAAGAITSIFLLRVLADKVHLISPQALPAVILGALVLGVLTVIATLVPTRQVLSSAPALLLRQE